MKRARSPPLLTGSSAAWLNLRKQPLTQKRDDLSDSEPSHEEGESCAPAPDIPRDLRKLIYSKLTKDDKCMIRYAHAIKRKPRPKICFLRNAYLRYAQQGHWNVLKWIVENHRQSALQEHEDTLDLLMDTNDTPLIQWFLVTAKHGLSLDTIGRLAAWRGNLDLLQWAFAIGCKLTEPICNGAASCGDMRMLEWLFVTHGCKWDWSQCVEAVDAGHVHVLQWAHAKGYNMDRSDGTLGLDDLCYRAAGEGKTDIMDWCLNNGCKYEMGYIYRAVRYSHMHVIEWADSRGYKFDEVLRHGPDAIMW
jgi:hypothetical protein